MSKQNFVKGECRHCGGHLKFPADSAGETIPCPHCGQSVELEAIPRSGRRVLLALIVIVGLAGAAVAFIGRHPHPMAGAGAPPVSVAAPASNTVEPAQMAIAPTNPPVESLRTGEVLTNDFAISGGKMQTTSDSSLVYVLGTVRNPGDRQRFGVKIDYALFDSAGEVIGHATDYQSEIDPHGEWDFKALVMESKAVAVRFDGITEQ